MKETKFRAWDKENKKMVSIISLHNPFYLPFCVYSTSQSSDGITELDYDKCEIMQFTGLKDKNGKEIFEGDVVKLKFEGINFISEIKKVINKFHNGFVYYWKDGEYSFAEYPAEICEVIGNIYDNPELLEEKK